MFLSCAFKTYMIPVSTVIENVVFDEHTREVDYFDKSVTGLLLGQLDISIAHTIQQIVFDRCIGKQSCIQPDLKSLLTSFLCRDFICIVP